MMYCSTERSAYTIVNKYVLGQHGNLVERKHPDLFSDDLALHVHGDEVCGEACEVSAGDGFHQSGLAGSVGTHQSVLASDLDSERSLVEQHSGTCRENILGWVRVPFHYKVIS